MISYALAIGCALALIGLYCEAAQHLNWSRRQKGWGGLILLIGAMGVVPVIAERVNEIALAAACSCIVLALGMRGNHTVVVKRAETEPSSYLELIDTPSAATPAEDIQHNTPPTAEVATEMPHDEIVIEEEVAVAEEETHDEIVIEEEVAVAEEETHDEIVIEEEVVVAAEEIRDEIVIEEKVAVAAEETNDDIMIEEEVALEEEIIVAEGETCDEIVVLSEEIDEVFVEEVMVIEEEAVELAGEDSVSGEAAPNEETISIPPIPEPELCGAELAAWLNEQIAAGYEAKAAQSFAQAARHFEAAALRTGDAELVAMLRDELADCCRELELRGESLPLRYAS